MPTWTCPAYIILWQERLNANHRSGDLLSLFFSSSVIARRLELCGSRLVLGERKNGGTAKHETPLFDEHLRLRMADGLPTSRNSVARILRSRTPPWICCVSNPPIRRTDWRKTYSQSMAANLARPPRLP